MHWPEELRAIRGRNVVLPGVVQPATVHVSGGRVTAIGAYDDGHAAIDAGDLHVFPGLVDTHVHVNEPGRTEWEGFETATRAAAAGGVTALLDMPLNSIPATTSVRALDEKRRSADGRCQVDVGFIGGVVPGNAAALRPLRAAGVFAFKCFLVPSGVDEFGNVGRADLEAALPLLADAGATLMVHAELPAPLLQAMRSESGDPRRYATWLASRPAEAETSAVQLMVDLVARHRCPVHIVHVSSAESLALLADARARGLPISAETCPHYLTIDDAAIPDAATEYKCAPPIRGRKHRDALWSGLERGVLDCIVSDHSPSPPSMKQGDFLQAWGGIASLELGLSVIWTEMRARGYTPLHLARWMSEAPARLFGLAAKGALAQGRDADLAIVDLDATFTVDPHALLQRHKISPYAGRVLAGRVAATYVRGQLVWADGAPSGRPSGQLLSAGAPIQPASAKDTI